MAKPFLYPASKLYARRANIQLTAQMRRISRRRGNADHAMKLGNTMEMKEFPGRCARPAFAGCPRIKLFCKANRTPHLAPAPGPDILAGC
ncbi:hypothetical protein [Paracoccus sp. N5]|uniref:hypothetical protein n=1 Tax=Paracoccus sp. N5 TaxID=1101189 RepID=UPI0012F745AD|nr:hypothetical protein [Paracoccus sp. N5]